MDLRREKRAAAEQTTELVSWTYELPPDGAGSEGLEGYAIESSTGEPVGTVFLVLRRGPEQYLALKRGLGFRRDAQLVPWSDVALIDHTAQTVRLAVSAQRLAIAPRLARSKGTHGEGAEAVRVTGLLGVDASRTTTRTDRKGVRFLGALGLAAFGFLTLLVAFVLASGPHWREREYALFALPAVLLLGALASGLGLLERKRADA